jgi:hypothetical protein
VVAHAVAPNWPALVHKPSLRADSFLARLSNEEFSAGMARLQDHRQGANQDDTVTVEIDRLVFTKRI